MTPLNDISHDSAAFTAAKAQIQDLLTTLLSGRLFTHWSFTPELQKAQLNHFLRVADFRDLALMLHAHLLSSVHFAHDISSGPYRALASMIDLSPVQIQSQIRNIAHVDAGRNRSRWKARFPGLPFDFIRVVSHGPRDLPPMADGIAVPPPFPLKFMTDRYYTQKSFQFDPPYPFSLDLVEAVKRQMVIARKIKAIYHVDPVPVILLEDSRQRYAKFMNLIRIGVVSAPVPALDIDLFWHTHQLSSSNYMPWCRHHIGREKFYYFMKLHERLAEANAQIVAMQNFSLQQRQQQQPGGFLTRLLKAAVATDPTPLETALYTRDIILFDIHSAQLLHRVNREIWGRRRWPLLVPARGWGDPYPSLGHPSYAGRPSQGTATVDFPLYAATWYNLKPLGFYDYVAGGDGVGAIAGGGARIRGGMCAARFNGGGGVAPLPEVRVTDTGGGSG